MSHSNISIFIPHIGCPCRCSFCNQIYITNTSKMPTTVEIDNAVEQALKSKKFDKTNRQLAFFGGSFTAIDKELMIYYLECGYKHIQKGNISSIRISTRPDAIDDDILEILKHYGVKSIELGAQSMCDDVLIANNRGHLSADVYSASEKIKKYGFELGLQMMTGLYRSSFEKDFFTAKEFINIGPDTVRVYPTVVIKNTELEKLYISKEYSPLSVDEASKQGAIILKEFYDNNIKVIRFGLHSIDEESFVAGAFHPALSEIAQSYIYRSLIENKINKSCFYTVFVNSREISKLIGQKKSNIEYFKTKNIILDIKKDDRLSKYEINIKERG